MTELEKIEYKHSKNAEQQIDIYFRYIGKLVPKQVA